MARAWARTAVARPSGSDRSELVPFAIAVAAAVSFYSLAHLIRGLRVPIADDTFFYVAAFRTAGRAGLATSHLAARPAYPLLGGMLTSAFHLSPWSIAALLPFVVATSTGLAAAALAYRWDVRAGTAAVFALLVALSPVVARLVAGKGANGFAVWLVTAALAVAALDRGRAASISALMFLIVAGLAESPLLLAFFAVVVATFATERWIVPGWSPRETRVDRPTRALGVAELAVVTLGACVAVALAVFVWNGTTPADAIQRLPPPYRYSARFSTELGFQRPLLSAGLFAVGWWSARATRPAEGETTRRVLTVWMAITLAVLAVGLLGVPFPSYRALTFALPLALGVAAAPLLPAIAVEGTASRAARTVWLAVGVVVGAAVLFPATAMWLSELKPKTDTNEVGQLQAASRYASSLPAGQHTVVVVDLPDPSLAAFYTRVLDAVAEEPARTHVFVGKAKDALAARPTTFDDAPLDAEARRVFQPLRPLLASGAAIVVTRDLDAEGFRLATVAGTPTIGADVAILRGRPPPSSSAAEPRAHVVEPLPVGPLLFVEAVAIFSVLLLCGIGWATTSYPEAPTWLQLALAPAYGVTALTVLVLVVERAGYPPTTKIALVETLAALAASAGLNVWARRRRSGFRVRPVTPEVE